MAVVPVRLTGPKRLKVIVLGCGPAGLFAAHAAVRAGHEVAIFSKKRKSHMYGAQYLHAPIPDLTDDSPSFQVEYRLLGTVADYATKVYGEEPPDFVSPEKLLGRHKAWDIRRAYDRAWSMYEGRIVDWEVKAHDLMDWSISNLDVLISTIPLPLICQQQGKHFFKTRKAWAIGDAPDRDQFAPALAEYNTVLCNGSNEGSWYRASIPSRQWKASWRLPKLLGRTAIAGGSTRSRSSGVRDATAPG
jgi:threonine dehydrogenase-like Zn-dependent dehydrogenase